MTTAESGGYVIDPDGDGGLPPFNVTCNMTEKDGIGVTVISHNSKAEHWWMDAIHRDATHVTFTIRERVCLSWRVSPESPRTVSSLSNMSVMVRSSFTTTNDLDGGYHAMQLR